MLTVYLRRQDIPINKKFVDVNDAFFNANINFKIIENIGNKYIESIDESKYLGNGLIKSRFGDEAISISNLSTGCKTLLNIISYPDNVFSLLECGWNVADEVFKLDTGMVYMPYNMIMEIVKPIKVMLGNKTYIIGIGEEEKLEEVMEELNNES